MPLNAEQDAGERSGPMAGDPDQLVALERENREMKRGNGILCTANSFLRRRSLSVSRSFVRFHRLVVHLSGVESICRILAIAPFGNYGYVRTNRIRWSGPPRRSATTSCARGSSARGSATAVCTACVECGSSYWVKGRRSRDACQCRLKLHTSLECAPPPTGQMVGQGLTFEAAPRRTCARQDVPTVQHRVKAPGRRAVPCGRRQPEGAGRQGRRRSLTRPLLAQEVPRRRAIARPAARGRVGRDGAAHRGPRAQSGSAHHGARPAKKGFIAAPATSSGRSLIISCRRTPKFPQR